MSLFDKLEVYAASPEAAAIQAAFEAVLSEYWTASDSTDDQYWVQTATWSLPQWERFLALPTDTSLSNTVRRERIISKLRGTGVSTIELIECVAESYYNGEVDITEQYADYKFTVTFLSTRGRPEGLEQLKAAIEEIKPAHLGVDYVFLYTTYDEIKAGELTYTQLAGYTYDDIKSLEVT